MPISKPLGKPPNPATIRSTGRSRPTFDPYDFTKTRNFQHGGLTPSLEYMSRLPRRHVAMANHAPIRKSLRGNTHVSSVSPEPPTSDTCFDLGGSLANEV